MRKKTVQQDPIKLAKEQFQIAAEAGCDLGLRWLKRLEDYENQEEKLKQIQQWHPLKESFILHFRTIVCAHRYTLKLHSAFHNVGSNSILGCSGQLKLHER